MGNFFGGTFWFAVGGGGDYQSDICMEVGGGAGSSGTTGGADPRPKKTRWCFVSKYAGVCGSDSISIFVGGGLAKECMGEFL